MSFRGIGAEMPKNPGRIFYFGNAAARTHRFTLSDYISIDPIFTNHQKQIASVASSFAMTAIIN